LAGLSHAKKITGVEYDAGSGVLTIQFTSKITRRYTNVPIELYEKFSATADKNKFYQLKIEGQYQVD
jgi:hypothetical protein